MLNRVHSATKTSSEAPLSKLSVFSPIILLEMYEFSSHALANAPNIVGQKHSSLHASTVLSEVAAARCCWFACPQFPTGLWLINIRSLSCLLRVLDVRYGIWLRVDTERGLIHLILRPPPPTPPAAGLVCSSRPSVRISISRKNFMWSVVIGLCRPMRGNCNILNPTPTPTPPRFQRKWRSDDARYD